MSLSMLTYYQSNFVFLWGTGFYRLPCGERIRPTAAVSKLKVEFPEPSNYFMKTVPENCLLGFDVVMVNPSDLRRDLMKLTRVPKCK